MQIELSRRPLITFIWAERQLLLISSPLNARQSKDASVALTSGAVAFSFPIAPRCPFRKSYPCIVVMRTG